MSRVGSLALRGLLALPFYSIGMLFLFVARLFLLGADLIDGDDSDTKALLRRIANYD